MSKEMTFEEKMKELDDIANDMESGDMTLEDSMLAYEKGMKIIKECEDYINTAKLKIKKIANGDSKEVH
ncbi:MAG: exodeoxyribonuclease VII small subunit [Clostridiales bacterium]|nr:exodeoxyribonuclease VII small subunit [Clostridiales bacterium]